MSICTVMALLAVAPAAQAAKAVKGTGGAQYGAAAAPAATTLTTPGTTTPGPPSTPTQPTVPGITAKFVGKVAYAPSLAPTEVKQAIWAANAIIGRPYVYGGGHQSFKSRGYDCSGTVSYALHGGGLLDSPLDSGSFMKWGDKGVGSWMTIYTNPGHAYLVIAGIRLDTSAADDPAGGKGPRWRPLRPSNRGFRARHPDGL